jgi:hypothetical protein
MKRNIAPGAAEVGITGAVLAVDIGLPMGKN